MTFRFADGGKNTAQLDDASPGALSGDLSIVWMTPEPETRTMFRFRVAGVTETGTFDLASMDAQACGMRLRETEECGAVSGTLIVRQLEQQCSQRSSYLCANQLDFDLHAEGDVLSGDAAALWAEELEEDTCYDSRAL